MSIKFNTDHKNFDYFITEKQLSKCQAHEIEFLSSLNFIISYILSKKNLKADSYIYYTNNLLSGNNKNY